MKKRLIVTSNVPRVDIYLVNGISETVSYDHLVSKHTIIEIPEQICVAGSNWENTIFNDLQTILGPEVCLGTDLRDQVSKKIKAHIFSAII